MFPFIKKYDKQLNYKRLLDGNITVYRQSPFNSQKNHELFTIANQYPGSWILNKLVKMDTQRFNIIEKAARNNKQIQRKKQDNRMHQDIGNFFEAGGEHFIN